MATMLAMYEHLDLMVLDYIERRPTEVLKGKFGERRTVFNHCGNGLTLEEIYYFYFREKELPTTFYDVNSETCVKRSVSKTKITPCQNLPTFPIELFDQILKYCPTKTLFDVRELNRSLNALTCAHLAKGYRKDFDLSSTVTYDRFLDTFPNGISKLGCPLGTYNLRKQTPEALRILDLVGAELRIVNLGSQDNILELLGKLPNVQELTMEEVPILGDFEGTKLWALRKLNLYVRLYRPGALSFLEYLKLWVNIAPCLAEVAHTRAGAIDSAQALSEFLHSHKRLKIVRMNDISLQVQLNRQISINLNVTSDDNSPARVSAYNTFFDSSFSSIKSLTISTNHKLTIQSLPNLTSLKVVFRREKSEEWSRILPNKFPALKHVTLFQPIMYGDVFQSAPSSAFHSVESLRVFDVGWILNQDEMPNFHIIFPRLNILSLGGFLSKNSAEYFSNNFPQISTLKFYDFESTARNFQHYPFPEIGKLGIQWPFSKLKNVKTMDFAPRGALRHLVMDLLNLTLKNCLQPLQVLSVTIESTGHRHVDVTQAQIDEARALFYSMSNLAYHKSLQFKCITNY